MATATIEDAKAVVTSHEQYVRANDLDGVMTNMAPDMVLLAAGAPLIDGSTAFREFYAGFLSAGAWELAHDYHGGDVLGETVFLHGVATGTFKPHEGETQTIVNNFMHVLRLGADGRLRMWRAAFGPVE